MLATLLPLFGRVVFTRSSRRGALPPATLESLARQLGGPPAEVEPSPRGGARAGAGAGGPRGRGRGHRLHLSAVGPRARGRAPAAPMTQHARMLGFVAVVVAVVILVFFALGYGLGRLLL